MDRNSNNRENNGSDVAPAAACAACRHQRKRCRGDCKLAPYFPAKKTKEFQAVQKVFGTGNLTKLICSVREVDRKRASESLIWEANWRMKEPTLGPQGEYQRVCEELDMYKILCDDLSRRVPVALPGGVVGWNGANGANGMENVLMNNNNNKAFSYNNNTHYGVHSHYVQNPDEVLIQHQRQQETTSLSQLPIVDNLGRVLKQPKEVAHPIVVPYQQQQQNSVQQQTHHLSTLVPYQQQQQQQQQNSVQQQINHLSTLVPYQQQQQQISVQQQKTDHLSGLRQNSVYTAGYHKQYYLPAGQNRSTNTNTMDGPS